MLGFDVALAFLVGLVWWEVIIFVAMFVAIGFSLNYESSIGFVIPIAILGSINWTGAGSAFALLSAMSFIGALWSVAVFIGIGVVWSFFKWRNLVKNIIANTISVKYGEIKYKISNEKSYDVIAFWILLWPMSVAGYVFNDLVRDFMKALIDRIYSIYDRITDKMLSNVGIHNESSVDDYEKSNDKRGEVYSDY